MELGSKSVLLSLDSISAAFVTIDTITVWAGVSLVSIVPQTDHATWPSEISGLTSGAIILAFLKKASLDLFSYALPSYLPSQGSWSFTGSGIINTQLHGCLLPGSIPNGGSHDVSALTFWFLYNRLQLYSDFWDHDPWLKTGSSQAGASRLGHWRW